MATGDGDGSLKPQLSTWDLIVQYCPRNEVDEVKKLLGSFLVEQAVDLHSEVSKKCKAR